MKKIMFLLIILPLLVFGKEVEFSRLKLVDGIYYENGSKFTGKSIKKFSNGNIQEIREIKNGKEKTDKEFYNSGKIKMDGEFHDNSAHVKEYYETGELKAYLVLEKANTPSQKMTAKSYYKNGVLEEELYIVEGGNLKKMYYESGQIKAKIESDGILGNKTLYYESGQVKEESKYKNDKRHGRLKSYDTKGKLTREIVFENGKVLSEMKY
ncbi:MAG: toxin-antitoxin system YwqK family antitoxin [Cetobacterium sp.]